MFHSLLDLFRWLGRREEKRRQELYPSKWKLRNPKNYNPDLEDWVWVEKLPKYYISITSTSTGVCLILDDKKIKGAIDYVECEGYDIALIQLGILKDYYRCYGTVITNNHIG